MLKMAVESKAKFAQELVHRILDTDIEMKRGLP